MQRSRLKQIPPIQTLVKIDKFTFWSDRLKLLKLLKFTTETGKLFQVIADSDIKVGSFAMEHYHYMNKDGGASAQLYKANNLQQ